MNDAEISATGSDMHGLVSPLMDERVSATFRIQNMT